MVEAVFQEEMMNTNVIVHYSTAERIVTNVSIVHTGLYVQKGIQTSIQKDL